MPRRHPQRSHSGSNPLAALDDGSSNSRVAVVENADGSLTVTRGGETLTLVPDGADRIRIIRNDTVIGVAERRADGGVTARNAAGLVILEASADEVEESSAIVAAALR